MKTKVIFHQFDPVVYPYKIWISITKDYKEISKIFTYKNNNEIDILEYKNSYASTDDVRERKTGLYGALIIFESKKQMTFEKVSHESCHAAKQLFEHIGADITPHEPFEYVVGFIAKCCGQVKINKYD